MTVELSDKTLELFYYLWRGGEYSYFSDKKRRQTWFKADIGIVPDPPERDVWYGVNPVYQIPATNSKGEHKPQKYIRAQIDYIAAQNCFFGDFDSKLIGDMADTLIHIESLKIEPSVIINSGGGFHCYWILENTVNLNDDNRELARQAQWNWVSYVKADPGVKDLTRVLRVPGTMNCKPQYGDGRKVEFIKTDFGLTYNYNVLRKISEPIKPEQPKLKPILSYNPTNDEIENGRNKAIERAMQMISSCADGEKHYSLLKASRLLGGYIAGGWGLDLFTAETVLRQSIEARGSVDSLQGAYSTIKAGLEYGMSAPITPQLKEAQRQHRIKSATPQANVPQPITNESFFWSAKYNAWGF